MLKQVALATVLLAGTAISALAAPITGNIGFTGAFQAENASGTNVPFGSATQIDFSPLNAGLGTGTFTINGAASSGTYLTLAGGGGAVGTIKDFVFSPFAALANFFSVGSLSFNLNSLNAPVVMTIGSTNFLNLSGSGILSSSVAGYDATNATFTFSGQTDGGATTGTFTFSGGSAVTVPEPASLALFGAGLLGLGLVRRRHAGKAVGPTAA